MKINELIDILKQLEVVHTNLDIKIADVNKKYGTFTPKPLKRDDLKVVRFSDKECDCLLIKHKKED